MWHILVILIVFIVFIVFIGVPSLVARCLASPMYIRETDTIDNYHRGYNKARRIER
jgi:hypothetical protein